MNIPVVVVPIYRWPLEAYEVISLAVLRRILGTQHPICFISHSSLRIPLSFPIQGERILLFDECYFSGIEGYNRLLLSREFYEKFSAFTYLLIYQMDCLVFHDRLRYWCDRGYGYIGAPWFTQFSDDPSIGLWAVGNGGFSLRNISAALGVLNSYVSLGRFTKGVGLQAEYADSTRSVSGTIQSASRRPVWKEVEQYPYNEDLFWSFEAPTLMSEFTVPTKRQALPFAFEKVPKWCFQKNWWRLPFGCHAWEKHDPAFWIHHLKRLRLCPDLASLLRDFDPLGRS